MDIGEVFDLVIKEVVFDEVIVSMFSLEFLIKSLLKFKTFDDSSLFEFFLSLFELCLLELRYCFLMLNLFTLQLIFQSLDFG